MYGVSKISSEQNIMLTTFPGAQYSAQSLAEHLDVFAKAGIVVDMICQSAPRGSAVDFSFTTSYDNFAAAKADAGQRLAGSQQITFRHFVQGNRDAGSTGVAVTAYVFVKL